MTDSPDLLSSLNEQQCIDPGTSGLAEDRNVKPDNLDLVKTEEDIPDVFPQEQLKSGGNTKGKPMVSMLDLFRMPFFQFSLYVEH